ncbi:MAG: ThuA domain-containing protein [Thermoguttaceae bacterium]|nr:ThuA domain-containing protein [Thermoguttaceae bacterium]
MKTRKDLRNFALLLAIALFLFPASFLDAAQKTRKVLYFDRSNSYVHPPTESRDDGTTVCGDALIELGKELNFEVVCTKDSSIFESDLSQFDAIFFYTCGALDEDGGESPQGMSPQGVANFFNSIRNGVGLIGVHSATDTWKTPGEANENQPIEDRTEYTKLIGGQFLMHGSQQETTLRVVEPVQLPFMKGHFPEIKYFDEWYCLKNFNPDMHVLMIMDTAEMNKDGGNSCYNRPPQPVVWARMEGKGRVAYSALGHNNSSWWDETNKGVVSDLFRFVLGDIDIDLTPNMETVTPGANILHNK